MLVFVSVSMSKGTNIYVHEHTGRATHNPVDFTQCELFTILYHEIYFKDFKEI